MKPYYDHAGITIYLGDCREILPTLALVDLVLTDPPYNAINRATGGLRLFDKGTGADADCWLPPLHRRELMAAADYYLCDVCGAKCFYDANLNYEFDEPPRPDGGIKLDYVGRMAAVCTTCAETHDVIVQPLAAASQGEAERGAEAVAWRVTWESGGGDTAVDVTHIRPTARIGTQDDRWVCVGVEPLYAAPPASAPTPAPSVTASRFCPNCGEFLAAMPDPAVHRCRLTFVGAPTGGHDAA